MDGTAVGSMTYDARLLECDSGKSEDNAPRARTG
jgi:hypothetical protein